MKISGVDIRPGNIIEYEGGIWRAVKIQHTQPGKGGAYMQVEMKNLIDGRKNNVRFRSAETVERVRLDTKDFQFLFHDGDPLVFMDKENYEQVSLPAGSDRRAGGLPAGRHGRDHGALQRAADLRAAPRHDRGDHRRGRRGGEGPDRLVQLQAGDPRQWRPRHGPAAYLRAGRRSSSTSTSRPTSAARTERSDLPFVSSEVEGQHGRYSFSTPYASKRTDCTFGQSIPASSPSWIAPRARWRGALAARFRRGRAASGEPQGAGRLRQPRRSAHRADPGRRARPRPPRLGHAAGGRRRHRGQSGQAALGGRSDRRHLQLPPRHPPFRDLDRGAGAEAGRRAGARSATDWSTIRSPTKASGPRRAGVPGCRTGGSGSPPAATSPKRWSRPACPTRRMAICRAFNESWRRLVRKWLASAASARQRSTSPGWRQGRYDGFWEEELEALGHCGGADPGARGGGLRHRFPWRRASIWPRARCWPRTKRFTRACTSWLAGALR